MPEALLGIFKLCFLALLYLFFLRVLRAVWAGMGPAVAEPAAGPAAVPGRKATRAAPRGAPRLTVVDPPEQRGSAYEVGDELTLGRGPACGATLDDTYASTTHARVYRKGAAFWVEDVGSTNGTYVNRRKLSGPLEVRAGDRIQVGRTVLELST